jgi:hypothetical protein
VLGDRILVKDEGASHADHGLYEVTTEGTVGVAFVLTRVTDADQDSGTGPPNEVNAGLFTFIEEGTLANTGWVLSTPNPITVDVTAISFTQFSGAGSIVAGAGLSKAGDTINVGDVNRGVQANADDLEIDASESAGDGLQAGGNSWQFALDLLASGGLKIVGASPNGELAVEPADFAGNGLEDDGADNLRVRPDSTETAPSIAVDANGVRAAVPSSANKNMTASVTASDGDQATVTTIAATPAGDGHVVVKVNGLSVLVGDGVTTGVCCYFDDGAAGARAIADIVSGDNLRWVGSVAGYELDANDRIDFDYNVAS